LHCRSNDLWLDNWSWLSQNKRLPTGAVSAANAAVVKTTTISTSTTWSTDVILAGQVSVVAPATLTIAPGVTVWALRDDGEGLAPALFIQPGAMIIADGTADMPITFQSALPPQFLPARGMWGGLVLLGSAPVQGGTRTVEGSTAYSYGGNNATDNSGVLRYVRVWHGGSVIGPNNEINGVTLAGVGSGTTVDYVEVAFNLDDCFEMFGGTVNLKHISGLFCGDDGIDTDLGYVGKIQFAYIMVGATGNHGAEMDGTGTNSPKSSPNLANVDFVGHIYGTPSSVSSDDLQSDVVRLREGTGGSFRNILITNLGSEADGVYNNDCASDTVGNRGQTPSNFLYWSPNNIINRAGPATTGVNINFGTSPSSSSYVGCTPWGATTANTQNPNLRLMPLTAESTSVMIDPRPRTGSPALSAFDVITPDGFFEAANYVGAFDGSNNWLAGLSWLDSVAKTPANESGTYTCGDITTNTVWSAGTTIHLACQVFVTNGATLTIQPGAIIKAYRVDSNGAAPALIVTQGSMINAAGTSGMPITFSSIVSASNLPQSGLWGGIILLGRAPIDRSTTRQIEGITSNGAYGGSNPTDNSGTLQYVRVWYGGAVIGADNEINGVTLGGVGSGTTIDHVEVAFNLDDGFELFGGQVDLKYISALYNGDDAIDTDESYQGRIQFAFVIVGANGDHATEMDSKIDVQPRAFPRLYNGLFVGHLLNDPNSPNADSIQSSIMHLREGTGGEFGNLILINNGNVGVQRSVCSAENTSQTMPTSTFPANQNYLWFSPNNIIVGPGNLFQEATGCAGLIAARNEDPPLRLVSATPDSSQIINPGSVQWLDGEVEQRLSNAWSNVDTVPDDDFFVQRP
jgi:hypothetical protein